MYQTLLQSLADGVYVAQDRRFVYANPALSAMLEYNVEELVGLPFEAVIAPEHLDLWIDRYEQRVGNGPEPPWEYEVCFLRRSGTRLWIELRARRIWFEGRSAALGIVRDISERKELLERERSARQNAERVASLLAESHALLDTIFATAPVGLGLWTPEFRFVRLNAKLAEIGGVPASDHFGKDLREIWSNIVELEDLFTDWEGLLETGRHRVTTEITETAASGSGPKRCWTVTGFPVRSCRRTVGVGAVVEEITERREADRRKSEFLAMLGHELRNPLAPIRNAVQIMRSLSFLDPKLAWARDVIQRQAEHLARLVDDLLDVSRIAQGKFRLERMALDLASAIDAAVEATRPLIEGRSHRFELSLAEEPLTVLGDEIRLAQVVSNLLSNAAKYTPPGGRIRLGLTRDEGFAVISVRDSGVGIPEGLLPQVFEAFTQSGRTLDRSEGGLGLGLTIVRNITALHGGWVEASSAGPGLGSEFIVRLPLLESAGDSCPGVAEPVRGIS